jgi:response regulator of citrate/malate metabolism
MDWRKLITPRVLIVEDKERQLQGLKNDIENISVKKLRELGIDHFVCDLAKSVQDARSFLKKSSGKPYDLLLLDLGIPTKTGEEDDPPENGLKILKRVRKTGIAKEIIVISIWSHIAYVQKVFRQGAFDFIDKQTLKTPKFQGRVMDCWQRIQLKESTQILGEERISELVPYSEKGLAYRFNNCFISLLKEIKYTDRDLEKYMQERYGLNKAAGSDEFFFKRLEEQNDSISKLKMEWDELQNSLVLPNEHSKMSDIETIRDIKSLLKETHQSLLPCLIVKNVEMEFQDEGAANVKGFGNDVSAVIKEVIIGILNKLPDYSTSKHVINIEAKKVNQQVRVIFSDKLEPISGEDAENINKGSNISPYRRFGREWGLSVV